GRGAGLALSGGVGTRGAGGVRDCASGGAGGAGWSPLPSGPAGIGAGGMGPGRVCAAADVKINALVSVLRTKRLQRRAGLIRLSPPAPAGASPLRPPSLGRARAQRS